METVTLSKKFQIVIPKKTREGLEWKPGQKIVLLEKGNSVELVEIGKIEEAIGIAKGASLKGLRDKSERFS